MDRLTTDLFSKRVTEIFGNSFEFTKTIYVDRETPTTLICNKCKEEFKIKPRNLYDKKLVNPCPSCRKLDFSNKKRLTTKKFINKAKSIHGDKFDYIESEYRNCFTSIKIWCNKCKNFFYQKPKDHLTGSGCQKCKNNSISERRRSTKENFVNLSRNIHKEDYSYENSAYIDSRTKIEVKCNSCGRLFKIRPDAHISGGGCICKTESIGEKIVKNFLTNKKVDFERNKRFKECRRKRTLSFDFYLPKFNVLIEYDGRQHFAPFFNERISPKNAKKILELQKESDKIKTEFARSRGITLVRIKYTSLKSIKKIVEEIINGGTYEPKDIKGI